MAGENVREAHRLIRYTQVTHPRIVIERPIPTSWYQLQPGFDYPRIRSENVLTRNSVYHQQSLRSNIMDPMLRSTQGPTCLPPTAIHYPMKWANEFARVDPAVSLIALTEGTTWNGGHVMVIPVFRHRIAADQENLVLVMVTTVKGSYLFNPLEHHTKRALKNMLESQGLKKILINASSEVPHYWTLLNAACRRIFCITGHLASVAKKNHKTLLDYYAPFYTLPRFERVFPDLDLGYQPVVVDCGQHSFGPAGIMEPIKVNDLLMYANKIQRFIGRMSQEGLEIQSHVDWELAFSKMNPYHVGEGIWSGDLWRVIATAVAQRKNMYIFLPTLINVFVREARGNAQLLKVDHVQEIYDNVINGYQLGQVPNRFTRELCRDSAVIPRRFRQCLQLKKELRKIHPPTCTTVGCFKDTWLRINQIAPDFVFEWVQGF